MPLAGPTPRYHAPPLLASWTLRLVGSRPFTGSRRTPPPVRLSVPALDLASQWSLPRVYGPHNPALVVLSLASATVPPSSHPRLPYFIHIVPAPIFCPSTFDPQAFTHIGRTCYLALHPPLSSGVPKLISLAAEAGIVRP